jgi:hypothetical protein
VRKNPLAVAALALLLIFMATGAFGATPKPNQSNRVSSAPPMPAAVSPARPDLIVEKIWVTATHPDASGGTRVDVQFTIFNNSGIDSWTRPTAAGTLFWFDHHDQPNMSQKFYSTLEMRELPNGVFPSFQYQGCLEKLAANSRADCVGAVVVPAGKKVEIRATVDSGNFIDESNEANNSSKPFVWQAVVFKPPLHK